MNKLKKKDSKSDTNLELLRPILDTIPVPIFYKDIHGIYKECNKEFTDVIGLKREDVIGRNVFEINQDDQQSELYNKADIDVIKNTGVQIYESKLRYSDGSIQDVVFRKTALVSNNGDVLGIVGVIINVTESKNNEKIMNKMLRIKETFIKINQSVMEFNNIRDFLNMILQNTMSIINEADYGSILKLNENNILEIVAYKNYDEEKAKTFLLPLKESFIWSATNGNIKDVVIIDDVSKLDCIAIDAVGSEKNWKVKSSISTPIIINEELYGILNIDSDKKNAFLPEDLEIMKYIKGQIEMVIYKHMLYEEKIYLSKYDRLTDLYNRTYFEELYGTCFSHDECFHVVIFDINNLKFVNDNYGHIIGDEYIRAFANELRNMANSKDIVARYGGDEFVGVFFNDNIEDIVMKIKHSIENLRLKPVNKEKNIFCSFSFGIASFPKDTKDFSQLINIADKRMYDYKRKYKSKVEK